MTDAAAERALLGLPPWAIAPSETVGSCPYKAGTERFSEWHRMREIRLEMNRRREARKRKKAPPAHNSGDAS